MMESIPINFFVKNEENRLIYGFKATHITRILREIFHQACKNCESGICVSLKNPQRGLIVHDSTEFGVGEQESCLFGGV
ncbi:MAG: hypothetical protein SPH08_09165, partial [Sodaliphilus sp.]|nr:hypothetical protein [Sodaliphilus sp.]